MRVTVSTLLRCAPERAWQEVQTPRLMGYVARPLVQFAPITPERFPDTWLEGRYLVRMRLFGIFPSGTQWIVIRRAAGPEYELFDDGHGELITQWRHHITLRRTPEGFTHYTDTVDLKAGWLTAGMGLYAHLYFRHRQRRWRRLVRNNFRYEEPAGGGP